MYIRTFSPEIIALRPITGTLSAWAYLHDSPLRSGEETGREGKPRSDCIKNDVNSPFATPYPNPETMPVLYHHYFGVLNSDGDRNTINILCEKKIPLNGREVNVCLCADAGLVLNPWQLDAYARLLEKLPELDTTCRAELCEYLQNDNSHINTHHWYIENNVFPEWQWMIPLLDNIPSFVAAMKLVNIELCASGIYTVAKPITLEYMIDPDHKQLWHILAVECDSRGNLLDIHEEERCD